MVRSPQVAKQLQESLEGQRDAKKAKKLYDMLRGYSKRQLQDGAAARLVADLDHEDLDCRVLAFWNLQRVAVGTLGYKPEYSQPSASWGASVEAAFGRRPDRPQNGNLAVHSAEIILIRTRQSPYVEAEIG